MPTRAGNGLGGAAKAVSEHVSSIARLEIQLALSELKRKAVALGLGVGLLIGAAIFVLLGFVFATIAVALSIVLDTWAAMLITCGLLALLAGTLAFLGITALSKGTPPVPEQALEEARLTTEALKSDG